MSIPQAHIQMMKDKLASGSSNARLQAMDWIKRNSLAIFQMYVANALPQPDPELPLPAAQEPCPQGPQGPVGPTVEQLTEAVNDVRTLERAYTVRQLRAMLDQLNIEHTDEDRQTDLAIKLYLNSLKSAPKTEEGAPPADTSPPGHEGE